MKDGELVDHSLFFPWSVRKADQQTDDEYFPNDYPIDEKLVTPPSDQQENRDNSLASITLQ